ncbi:hypothetical protein BDZ89DRAFT_1041242 [Hymenopellis radicata]|nr:hypothetical protein BDZ89DRAFT_1041242 [Hymenopellis radicata]
MPDERGHVHCDDEIALVRAGGAEFVSAEGGIRMCSSTGDGHALYTRLCLNAAAVGAATICTSRPWGMPIGEMLDLQKLCKHTGHYTFFFSSWPIPIIGDARRLLVQRGCSSVIDMVIQNNTSHLGVSSNVISTSSDLLGNDDRPRSAITSSSERTVT